MLKLMRDSFVVSKMLESFQISDYYTQTYSSKEVLPLIPVLDLWGLFMVKRLDCGSCNYNVDYRDEFIKQLEIWAKEANDKCYTENKI